MSMIEWGSARLTWSPDGYTLTIEHRHEARAAYLLERSLESYLMDLDIPYVTVEPGKLTRNERGANQEWGRIIIATRKFLPEIVSANEFRDELDRRAQDAEDEAAEQQRNEDAAISLWLSMLRPTG